MTANDQYIIAQSGAADDVVKTAEHLSNQSVSVWFVIVVILFGGGIFWLIRLLIKMYEREQKNHAEIQAQLIQFLQKDHSETKVLVRENTTVMGEAVKLLEMYQRTAPRLPSLRHQPHAEEETPH